MLKLSSLKSQSPATLLFKRSLHFFSGTMLSRMCGMIRDISMAFSFGASDAVSLFMMAFRFSNLPRRLFGEGALQSIIIARYEQLKTTSPRKSQQECMRPAAQFYLDSALSWALIIFGIISLIIYPFIFLLESSWVSGFLNHYNLCSYNTLFAITYFCKLMLPGLWFICMSAQNDAFIKSQRHFLFVSSAPAIFNTVWIIFALSLASFEHTKALPILSMGIVLAFASQWMASQIRSILLLRKTFPAFTSLRPKLLSDNVKTLIRPLLLGIIGVGALQINALLDAMFALYAELAGPSFLWYAIRIEQAPLSLIGMAIASASLPCLAKAIKDADFQRAKQLFTLSQDTLRVAIIMTASALFALGLPVLRLILEHGEFTSYQSLRTAQCLWAYTLGLTPHCLVFLYQNALFSLNHVRAVTSASLISVVVNCALNAIFIFIFHMSALSVALSTSIAAFVQLYFLKRYLKNECPSIVPATCNIRLLKEILLLGVSWVFAIICHSYVYTLNIDLFLSTTCQECMTKATLWERALDCLYTFSLWSLFYLSLATALGISPLSKRKNMAIKKAD